jgi:hypothetical protein
MRVWAKELAEYERSLEHGNLPQPTPPDADNPPRYRFALSSKAQGEFYAEIVDYAGELINPALLNNENEFAKKIRKKMRNLDGILVLAVTPEKREQTSEIPDEIGKLQTAFSSLTGTMEGERQCPVVLVLTKWDRYSDIPVNALAAEQNNVAQFLADNPMYQSLRQALENSIGEDHFTIFPMSGLGKCTNGKPDKVNPLQSFGVPFPFCWLAEHINSMEVERLEKIEKNLPWQWLPFVRKTWKAVDEPLALSAQLLNRLPEKETATIEKVRVIQQKVEKNSRTRVITLLLVLLLLWYGGIHISNDRMLQYAAIAVENSTDTGRLDTLERKLVNYAKGSYFPLTPPHFWIGTAKKLLTEIDGKREESAYNEFNNAPPEPQDAKIKAGNEYLTKYPKGNYSDKVQQWFAHILPDIVKKENQAAVDSYVLQWEPNKMSSNTNTIQGIIQKGTADNFFRYPNYATDEQKKKRNEVITAANERLIELSWETYKRDIQSNFNEGKYAESFKALALPDGKKHGEKWQSLCRDILSQTENKVDDKVREYATNYSGAITFIKEIAASVSELSNAGVDGADTLLQSLNHKVDELNVRWDTNLYSKVRSNSTETVCNNYLNTAPLKTMNREVQQYLTYIQENRAAQENYERQKQEFLDRHKGEGKVPPYPTGAKYWRDDKGKPWLWTSPQYLYTPGQFLPVGTKIHAVNSGWSNIGSHTISQITESDITESDVPRNMPTEPSLPEWRK